uniref:Uncharacterized protein n=1 Tax=Tanacetum cinerariifolium TaxID=118510 RepID=A0A6L2N5D0_TANCI|nr:hypothetical protein [Tanacetum cinerariifolium]
MDDPNMTMEEYVQLETEKALRHKFLAIVYDDTLTSEPEDSSEPMVSPHHVKEVDLKIKISFSELDDKGYTVIYDNDSFSYKIILVNDLKPNSDNNDDKINVKLSSKNISIKPLDSVIDTNVDTYSHACDENFETNHDIPSSIPFEPSQFYKDGACMKCYGGQDITALPPRAERYLWLRLIAFSIAGRGQTPEKVTTTKPLYLRCINEGMKVNVPYLLAYYLFRHDLGRKQGVRMFEGVKADPSPTEATQILQATAPAPWRVGDRVQRLEEEVYRLGEIIVQQGTRTLMVALLAAHKCHIRDVESDRGQRIRVPPQQPYKLIHNWTLDIPTIDLLGFTLLWTYEPTKRDDGFGRVLILWNSIYVVVMLVLDEEQLAFLADPRVADCQDTQTTITHNVAF